MNNPNKQDPLYTVVKLTKTHTGAQTTVTAMGCTYSTAHAKKLVKQLNSTASTGTRYTYTDKHVA